MGFDFSEYKGVFTVMQTLKICICHASDNNCIHQKLCESIGYSAPDDIVLAIVQVAHRSQRTPREAAPFAVHNFNIGQN